MNSHLPLADESRPCFHLSLVESSLPFIFGFLVRVKCVQFHEARLLFFIWIPGLSEVCKHKHSQEYINNGNDDKIVDVENIVESENDTENNVEVEELFEDDKSSQN